MSDAVYSHLLKRVKESLPLMGGLDYHLRTIIRELNSMGLLTASSCSGLRRDHIKRYIDTNIDARVPSVSICVPRDSLFRMLYLLRQHLYGTGWQVCISSSTGVFSVDGTRVMYPMLKIYYPVKRNDSYYIMAWEVLLKRLNRINFFSLFSYISPV